MEAQPTPTLEEAKRALLVLHKVLGSLNIPKHNGQNGMDHNTIDLLVSQIQYILDQRNGDKPTEVQSNRKVTDAGKKG